MKRIGFLIVAITFVLISISPASASTSTWFMLTVDDPSVQALTPATTTTTNPYDPSGPIPLGLAPAAGDGWTFRAETDRLEIEYYASQSPENDWGAMDIYIDGRLVKTQTLAPCRAGQCYKNGPDLVEVEMLYGWHTFKIVNSGSPALPINLLWVAYTNAPLVTTFHFLPLVITK